MAMLRDCGALFLKSTQKNQEMNRPLRSSLTEMLTGLAEILSQLTDFHYTRSLPVLSGATLGGHVRHIIEFFRELENSYQTGQVNYDARLRDQALENDRDFAIQILTEIAEDLKSDNKTLYLVCKPDIAAREFRIETNYERELLYNLEHTVHHMALLKIGIREIAGINLPEHFGVAQATIQYHHQQCVQ